MSQSEADKSKAIIARNLTRIRTRRGMNQSQLARSSGIHRIQIHRYENQTSLPTMATLAALAKGLNVRIPELLV